MHSYYDIARNFCKCAICSGEGCCRNIARVLTEMNNVNHADMKARVETCAAAIFASCPGPEFRALRARTTNACSQYEAISAEQVRSNEEVRLAMDAAARQMQREIEEVQARYTASVDLALLRRGVAVLKAETDLVRLFGPEEAEPAPEVDTANSPVLEVVKTDPPVPEVAKTDPPVPEVAKPNPPAHELALLLPAPGDDKVFEMLG